MMYLLLLPLAAVVWLLAMPDLPIPNPIIIIMIVMMVNNMNMLFTNKSNF